MSNPSDRTRNIDIQDDNLNLHNIQNAPVTFDLGIKPPHSPSEAITAQKDAKILIHTPALTPTPNHIHQTPQSDSKTSERPVFGVTMPHREIAPSLHKKVNKSSQENYKHKPTIHQKIWHGLEFLSLTAAIFMVFFLFINYQSYSQLFVSKLNQLRGQYNQNPYVLQEKQDLKNASPQGQKPLPIVQNPEASKKQFPEINLDITPPDDRILIPRIDQNVPVVRVPTDKLLQKDWSALEGQIQDALRLGVVHFPGTAMPGEHGNVVITGHSSYFPWDPGRFKDVFASLHQVNIGDQIIVYHDQIKYIYKVTDKVVVHPDQVNVLTQNGEDKLTLITCTPVGTALNRLVITAKSVVPVIST